jgi:hypothetical protein
VLLLRPRECGWVFATLSDHRFDYGFTFVTNVSGTSLTSKKQQE